MGQPMNEAQWSAYTQSVENIYKRHFSDVAGYRCMEVLLACAGKIYSDIMDLNLQNGLWRDRNEHDNVLVYLIAGRIKDEFHGWAVDNIDRTVLAAMISDEIFHFVNVEQRFQDALKRNGG